MEIFFVLFSYRSTYKITNIQNYYSTNEKLGDTFIRSDVRRKLMRIRSDVFRKLMRIRSEVFRKLMINRSS